MSTTYAALFDMDGVLVDNHEMHLESWRQFFKRRDMDISDEEITRHFGSTNVDYMRAIFGDSISMDEIHQNGREKEEIYREIYAGKVQEVKGLTPFLKDLKAKGFVIAVATSGPMENIKFILKETGTEAYFDVLVDAFMVENGKPHPDIYQKAAKQAGADPENCIVFEDSPQGIESGNAAGMKVIGLSTTHSPEKLENTVHILDDFTETDADSIMQMLKK